ncbi:hypothetical protein OR263_29260 [Streptomyces sp. NEAU-H22]|uniref:hypothetical protein n=1 Tax=Streptomyces sp. NEAU-H22 TaxID=2994655 RepID=UPI002254B967|nr:hypothetical protein [Streptomyces sp. NEAU-H22]MCX3290746.1 hypothetical protein [Streptomyces sp. NEAU-H22]
MLAEILAFAFSDGVITATRTEFKDHGAGGQTPSSRFLKSLRTRVGVSLFGSVMSQLASEVSGTEPAGATGRGSSVWPEWARDGLPTVTLV